MTLSTPLLCLAAAIYFEAGNQPVDGKYAVGQVILNRVRSRHYPDTVCGVVKQRKQFSFYWDGKRETVKRNHLEQEQWEISSTVAYSLLYAVVPDRTGGATFYHSTAVHPGWASSMTLTYHVRSHLFYRREK